LEKNELIPMPDGTSHGMKRSTFGSGGQRSRSYEVKDRFQGLAEASFSTPFGRVAFLVYVHSLHGVSKTRQI